VRQDLERSGSAHALLGFLTVTHASLLEPIRLVSDVFDYELEGVTYLGLPFEYKLVTDSDRAPTASLTVQNIDRRIGTVLRNTNTRAQLALKILSSADFDLSREPRVALGATSTIYAFSHFELSDVSANVLEISGTVKLFDPSTEPWPHIRATQTRAPGLYR
jgi:hypothetical protein